MKNVGPRDESKSTNSNADVGYGRPPKRTRFKPGRSGNPRGRPKVERHFGMALRDALKREFEIADEHGVKRKMPAYDVIARGLVASAARRDRFATKQLLDQVNFYILGGVRPEDPKELKSKGLDARTEIRQMMDQLAARRRAAEDPNSSSSSGGAAPIA
jgi:Family of unknown function (DUF5681)